MSSPNPKDPTRDPNLASVSHGPGEPDPGYEVSDIKIRGIAGFLIALTGFVLIFFVLCFGMGKLINHELVKHDGPPNVWNNMNYGAELAGKREDMASNPEMEQKQLQQMVTRFSNPRLQLDDGNQDLADMHGRESLLLNHYSWADQSAGKVRIPIERAMELIAQRGLPVAQPLAASANTPQLAGAEAPSVQLPLTNGYAPTAYEEIANTIRIQRLEGMKDVEGMQDQMKDKKSSLDSPKQNQIAKK